MRRGSLGWLVLGATLLSAPAAFGQSSDAATAELLFQQGRDLLRLGKAAEACPKLAESQRLDPATGTLLALAMCHEAEGKLASAWAEFVNVEARSRSEGRADREKVSHDRAAALKARLSTLEIDVAGHIAGLDGIEIRRDGVLLGGGAWNTAVPVDGGQHVVEVTAHGRQPWKGSVSVKPEGDAQALKVPELEAAPVASTALTGSSSAPPAERAPSKGWNTLQWAGVGTAGAGIIALGVGGYFLSGALGKKSDSKNDCDQNLCGDQGTADRNDAVSKGNTATWVGIAGGVLVAGGATLFIVGQVKNNRESAGLAGAQVAFGASPQGFGARLSTHF
jgi:serine/threonine-protein kinase